MIPSTDTASTVPVTQPETDHSTDLQWLLDAVTRIDTDGPDAALIDRIAALERLKAAAAAVQAKLTATFTDSRTADAAARHHRMDAARRSIAGQIALARRDSPHAGRRHVGVAAALIHDLPHTLAALTCGDLSERRVRIIVEQLACLTPTHRREADRLLAPELPGLGDRSAQTRAAAIAIRLDPEAVMGKIRGAVKDRHVGLRPAPEAMSRLSALLPVAMGVSVYAALARAAATATAAPGGDPRNRGQLMADALVSAVTGHTINGCDDYGVPHHTPTAPAPPAAADTTPAATAHTENADTATSHGIADADTAPDAPAPTPAPAPAPTSDRSSGAAVALPGCTGGCGMDINLIMTDRTLFDGDDEPAYLSTYGSIPAALARALVIGRADTSTRTFIRRLYTNPAGDQLTTIDSKRRLFPPAAQRFLLARDQTCRSPWRDAPIREYDHVQPHADGGPTTIINGQGVCKACNLTKQAPGWTAHTTGETDHAIDLTVPTGHHYTSIPPPPPTSRAWHDYSRIEHAFLKMIRGTG